MWCNICVMGKTLLGDVRKIQRTELVKWLCASTGLSEVLRTRTTVSGPNTLGVPWQLVSSITVSSCNPLWDYIDMLSLHKLFLPCEIHYWCQFDNGVLINDLCCRSKTESLLWMRTRGSATRRMLVSRSLVMIRYGITLMCYIPWTFPWNNFYVVCQVIKQHLSSLWIKRAYHFDVFFNEFATNSEVHLKNYQNPSMSNRVIRITSFMCGLLSLDFGGDYTHTSSLCILCCKGGALELFSVERQLISSQMEINSPCCWDAGVCSFALLFNPCIPEPSQFISPEETDEQHDRIDFYSSAWSPVNKSELSTIGLSMDNKRITHCQR
jgi:hypothetical protein